MRSHFIYTHCILSLFVPSPCSATLGAHLSTLKARMVWQEEGARERAERRGRSRGPTKIRWSARSRAETEENAKQTMPPLSLCVSQDLLVAVLICSYFEIRCTSFRRGNHKSCSFLRPLSNREGTQNNKSVGGEAPLPSGSGVGLGSTFFLFSWLDMTPVAPLVPPKAGPRSLAL